MKLLITGVAGFVGVRLMAAALAAGHQVVGVSRQSAPKLPLALSDDPNFGLEACDLTNREVVRAIFQRQRPEAVLHAAARIPTAAQETLLQHFDDNLVATVNVLQASRETEVRRVVYSSSMSVYGTPSYLPVDEQHSTVPSAAYGWAKLHGEQYGKLFAESGGPEVVSLRYSGIFGQGQGAGAIPIFINRCLGGEPITLHAGGRPTSDYVWVEDVARANLLAVARESQEPFEVFNIGGGVETSVATLAETIQRHTESASEIQRSEAASARDFRFAYDISHAATGLGYIPTAQETALREFVRQRKAELV